MLIRNHLKLRILDHDLLRVSARLLDCSGNELLRVVENHVRVASNKLIVFDHRAGRARITLPTSQDFIPRWMIEQVRELEPAFAAHDSVTALDLHVLAPGLVRVQGCWPDGDTGVVITERALRFCQRGRPQPLSVVGEGANSVLQYAGPITKALFGFG